MSASVYPRGTDPRTTSQFPIPHRLGIRFFRQVTRAVLGAFGGVGNRVYFLRDAVRGLVEPPTYLPEMVRQMYNIGVGSVPLTVIVAAFIGSVIALQTRYQLFPGVQLSVVGLISRQMIILELGPLLTGLVLTGRVGARMTAEIGTMRVTEQIDALETLAYDPFAFLVVPRILAALVMLPMLTILANATAILTAWLTLIIATTATTNDYVTGLRLSFTPFQVTYSVIKAFTFGGAIAVVCSYEGYVTTAGAEGVGRSTAKAVVIASTSILVLDAIVAAMFAHLIAA